MNKQREPKTLFVVHFWSDQTIDCILCIKVYWQGVSLFWLGMLFSETLNVFFVSVLVLSSI